MKSIIHAIHLQGHSDDEEVLSPNDTYDAECTPLEPIQTPPDDTTADPIPPQLETSSCKYQLKQYMAFLVQIPCQLLFSLEDVKQ
jgi:hypothetical protein